MCTERCDGTVQHLTAFGVFKPLVDGGPGIVTFDTIKGGNGTIKIITFKRCLCGHQTSIERFFADNINTPNRDQFFDIGPGRVKNTTGMVVT